MTFGYPAVRTVPSVGTLWWVFLRSALLATFALAISLGTPGGSHVKAYDDEVAAVLDRVAASVRLPEGIRFSQSVSLRALLFRWQFDSDLHFTGDTFDVTTRGAPAFVPATLPQELVEISRSISIFDLKLIGGGPSESSMVMTGPVPGYSGQGAREGTFWIDVERGVIDKAEAVYSWGRLLVEQEYRAHGDHLVLARQSAQARPHGFTLEIVYRDYQLP